MRGIFNGHATTNKIVGSLNLLIGVPQMGQQIKSDGIELLIGQIQNLFAKFFAQHKLVECKTDIKNPGKLKLNAV